MRFFLISLFLFLSACDQGGDSAKETSSTDYSKALPAGLLVDGKPIDPFCFAVSHSFEDGLSDVPVRNCESDLLQKEEEFEKGPQSYGVHFSYKSEEHSMARPYMLYQFVGPDLTLPPAEAPAPTPLPAIDEDFPVILYYNTGGTGNFSNLLWLRRDGDVLKLVKGLAAGDRCMGGIAAANIAGDGYLTYRVHTTMADMLNFTADPEREIMQTEAAKSLPFCATCCYGEAEFDDEEFRGVYFPPGRSKPEEGEGEAARCIENLVALNEQNGKSYFAAEDFGFFVREIEHTCLGRMEGE